ncbi:hypothetical protein OKW45_002526 [Paraburkholderia sp. WSM4175]
MNENVAGFIPAESGLFRGRSREIEWLDSPPTTATPCAADRFATYKSTRHAVCDIPVAQAATVCVYLPVQLRRGGS